MDNTRVVCSFHCFHINLAACSDASGHMIASGGGRLEEMTARPGWFHEDICFGGEEDEGSEDKEE